MNADLERIWKEAFLAQSKHYPSICQEGLRKPLNTSVRSAEQSTSRIRVQNVTAVPTCAVVNTATLFYTEFWKCIARCRDLSCLQEGYLNISCISSDLLTHRIAGPHIKLRCLRLTLATIRFITFFLLVCCLKL
jgi:hypothetical protein